MAQNFLVTSVLCLKKFNSESKQNEPTHSYLNRVAKSLKELKQYVSQKFTAKEHKKGLKHHYL